LIDKELALREAMGCLQLHIGNEPILRLAYSKKVQKPIKNRGSYYPFGLQQKGYNDALSGNVNHTANRFGYGGKENNPELGLNWMDFDARNYDAALGRWMNIDPLADSYLNWSPYNYSFNSPIIFFDPTGLGPIYDKDGNLIGYEVEEGQGPSQIAEDLNTIGLQAEVTYLDIVNSNPEEFEHIEDVNDINDEGFKKLDINPGDEISLSTIIDRENGITEDKILDSEISNAESDVENSVAAKDKLNNQIDSLQNEWMKIEEDPKLHKENYGGEPGFGLTLRRILKQTPIELSQRKKGKQVDSVDDVIEKQKSKRDSLKNLRDN